MYSIEENSGKEEGGVTSISGSDINRKENSDRYALRIIILGNWYCTCEDFHVYDSLMHFAVAVGAGPRDMNLKGPLEERENFFLVVTWRQKLRISMRSKRS